MPDAEVLSRHPLCAHCRRRHKAHTALAYRDNEDRLYRCAGCHRALDVEGECGTDNCCGNPGVVGVRYSRTFQQ